MTSKRSELIHSRNVQLLIMLLLALSSIGFFFEMRRDAALRQASAQGLVEGSALGLSGGRARGGSFDRPSQPAGPSGGSLPPSFDNSPSYGGGGYYPGPSYPRTYPSYPRTYPSYPRSGGTVIVPAPYPGGYVQTYPAPGAGSGVGLLFLLLVLGFMVLPVILNLIKLKAVGSPSGAAGGSNERLNDIVTVTELQVALLAQARTIQADLDRIASRANLADPVELNQMLQETVLALLRSPENWSHARVSSQTVRSRDQAAQLFEQLSIAERSKFAQETLVNMSGDIRRQSYTPRGDEDPAAYIVVTLLVGTADDQPLVAKPIYSADDLKAVLKRLGSISPSYLLVYELLWAPQDPSDSLSRDQLLTLYPDLTQIA